MIDGGLDVLYCTILYSRLLCILYSILLYVLYVQHWVFWETLVGLCNMIAEIR